MERVHVLTLTLTNPNPNPCTSKLNKIVDCNAAAAIHREMKIHQWCRLKIN